MAGIGIEDALELWALSLREVKRRIRPLFTQERVALSAGLFLDGLLGPERRKTAGVIALPSDPMHCGQVQDRHTQTLSGFP